MKRIYLAVLPFVLFCSLLGCFQYASQDSSVPRMTKEELRSLLDKPNVVVIDVRLDEGWRGSEWKIKGAVREDPQEGIDSSKFSKEKTLVFY